MHLKKIYIHFQSNWLQLFHGKKKSIICVAICHLLRFRKFKVEFQSSPQFSYVSRQLATDVDKLYAAKKLRLSASKRNKHDPYPMRSDGVNGMREVNHNFVLKMRNDFLGFLSHYFKNDGISDYLYLLYLIITKIYFFI